jgi:hypothetical protein
LPLFSHFDAFQETIRTNGPAKTASALNFARHVELAAERDIPLRYLRSCEHLQGKRT